MGPHQPSSLNTRNSQRRHCVGPRIWPSCITKFELSLTQTCQENTAFVLRHCLSFENKTRASTVVSVGRSSSAEVILLNSFKDVCVVGNKKASLFKSSGQRYFSYQAPRIWNKFPASICHASSVRSFKSSLKTFLFSKTVSSVPMA